MLAIDSLHTSRPADLIDVHRHVLTRPISTGYHIADNSSAEEKQFFMDEINVMKRVSYGNHLHVLKMLGCVTATDPMMLVLQFVPQGNLKNYLRGMKTVDNVRDVIVRMFMTFRYFLLVI